MLELERVSVSYGNVRVLWDVYLRVGEGEVVTLIGPNGAGKSTLLKTIMGQLTPWRGQDGRGSILFRGEHIEGMATEAIVRLGIALVPEGSRVFPEMTVLDNLKMGSFIPRARARRDETLEGVFSLFPRLEERGGQLARTLSGGERQMLSVGRALMSCPDLLLLDEPSLGLQPTLVSQTFEALAEVNRRGVTVLLVEQKVSFALEMSRRAYVLERGRVVLEGEGGELMRREEVKRAYFAL